MKTIGLLGGMSWESTLDYYRAINERVRDRLGGLHSARIAMISVDFEPVEKLQRSGDWAAAARVLASAAVDIQAAGADFLLICTNTMHRIAGEVAAAVDIPLLHIADATAGVLAGDGLQRVGLLGTAFTMEQAFYRGRLEQDHGLQVIVPGPEDRAIVHRVIYEELCLGRAEPRSRADYLRIIDDLATRGAEGVILGCTEIGMLVKQEDTAMKLYDTTAIHAERAVAYALGDWPDCLEGDDSPPGHGHRRAEPDVC